MFEEARKLLDPKWADADAEPMLRAVGFSDSAAARKRLLSIAGAGEQRQALAECLPMLLSALSDAATPDGSLINFERFVQSIDAPLELFRYLSANPRAVEILIKLFVGSQFLTEILLRHPDYLERLTQHKRIAEIKSRQEFVAEEREAIERTGGPIAKKLDALRRFQRWELLRIGACDSFGLLDMKSVTVQLSLLADSLVQSCLSLLAAELDVDPQGFAVLAFGKMGGEELNYSSDIDLVFLADEDATRFWALGQRLIKVLMEATGEGFLYRVDMRLRPWGRSGSLVNTVDAHISYLKKSGMLWEKQALLKARVIAGDEAVGRKFLQRAEPLIFDLDVGDIRKSIREMKEKIEADLERQGRKWGEVKSGEGSIRDIEFVTQCLQLVHGRECPEVRSFNTLDALVRLADFGYVHANEFRHLTSGYVFLRTIEHSLQLMHHKQTHSLPDDRRELAYLARRLDFADADQFLAHYRRHCDAVRAIYDKYIGDNGTSDSAETATPTDILSAHLARMEPSYSQTYSEEEVAQHVALLEKLSEQNVVEVEAKPLDDGRWQVTIVGYNHVGNLSMICGLLFVYGFDILEGQAFTDVQVLGRPQVSKKTKKARHANRFVDVFVVRPPLATVLSEVWERYRQDLAELMLLVISGQPREAQGQLAKRVGGALRESHEEETPLFAVEIAIDNDVSERMTVLEIRSEDTTGFLYELSNALALAGIDTVRLIVSTSGNRVFDTLYVTDIHGEKIIDPDRQQELRAAVVLIKHFTHLLPRSPNPEAALLRFREFLEQLFQQPDWLGELASLERTEVLDALSRLLGVSSFLWEDFLRLQHANLFPVVRDVEALKQQKSKDNLRSELQAEQTAASDEQDRLARLNAFKDREMFRTDMRHIMGHITEFGQFSAELTDLAEVIVEAAYEICDEQLRARYGTPRLDGERTCPLTICALGKCGGRELGFASDIELMFVYEDNGSTTGPETITTFEYFQKLVELFTQAIRARQEGIFQVDLRLRPYGQAGSLAVSLDAFETYFGPEGAAWPYERQALVKLRPIAGDPQFGKRLVQLRDDLVYTGEAFDVPAMLAMREKQLRQLVKAGTFHAKLSPGGLVDVEYLVQGLQMTHGKDNQALRATNTRRAMRALHEAGILSKEDHRRLEDAYIFQRQLIDAMRMVRGNARDLTMPPADSEEFEYLARRLGYRYEIDRLSADLERHTSDVQDINRLLDSIRQNGRTPH